MLPTSINITVNKDSFVPLRDQLVEQIGLQIASGILKGNDKLPSIRALAQKLDIHHGVVSSAYNKLAEIGMLEIRHGSGVRVVPKIGLVQNRTSSDLFSLFTDFVSEANKLGYSLTEIDQCYEQFAHRSSIKRIVVVDRNPDFDPVILSELTPHFSLPIIVTTASNLQQNQSLLKESLIITSLYHFLAVQALPIDPTRFLICNVEPGKEIVNVLKSLPDNSTALLISVSPTLLKIAINIAAGLRGETIIVKPLLISEKEEIAYTIPYAKVVICDLPSKNEVLGLAKKIPVHVFNLYSATTIKLIQDSLGK